MIPILEPYFKMIECPKCKKEFQIINDAEIKKVRCPYC